jgi:2-polyprenyl-3-methyl-5-hydroxy-6-metoxy-1,4-benzoquinol methylase
MNTFSTFAANDGDDYEIVMGRWSERLSIEFLNFVGTRDGDLVLDVGCGTGHLAQAVAMRSTPKEVHAIDLAPAYIDFAKRRNRNSNVIFGVGNACALNFADSTFDSVLSLLVLHFVPQTEQAIAEMARVAKPGGAVAACVWDVRGGYIASRMFYDTAAALDPRANERRAKNYTRPMTKPGELARAWREAGMHEIAEASLGIRMDFGSFDDYWAPYERREGPAAEYLAILSKDERSRLVEALRAAYLDGEVDGPRSYSALAWAVKGIIPI